MADIKKVLIITYYWPPSGGGGVQRWLKFSKYLLDFGWEPVVYTPENPTFYIKDESLTSTINPKIQVFKNRIWEPYGLAGIKNNAGVERNNRSTKSKVTRWVRANLLLPDPRIFWVRPSIKFLSKIIQEQDIEYMVTTGPPHSMHLIGYRLKKRFKTVKWIVDFRDPMANFNFYLKLNPTRWAYNYMLRLENKILNTADLIIGTSSSTAEFLNFQQNSKYRSITNGWDQVDFDNYKDLSKDNDKYILLHSGSIKSDRIPNNLFHTMNSAIEDGLLDPVTIELRLIGNVDISVRKIIEEKPNLKMIVNLMPYVSHSELISTHYAQANALLLLVNNSSSSKANIPAKLFEYIAIGKPIIAIGKENDDACDILNKAGINTYTYNQKIDYEDLNRSMSSTVTVNKETYSRKYLTQQLSNALNSLNPEK